MPKPRMSEMERRNRAIRKAISRIMIDRDIRYQKDFAVLCGITPARFSDLSVGGFQRITFDEFCKIAATGMTTQELLAATGRPYTEYTVSDQ